MIDYTKIQEASAANSNKLLTSGSGTISVAALGGAGETQSTATIPLPLGYASDFLIPQVTTTGGGTDGVIIPWQSNDGRVTQYIRIDSTNLYITVISQDSSGFGSAAFTVTYYYRLLIP